MGVSCYLYFRMHNLSVASNVAWLHSWMTFWRMIVHNARQMKDPPLVSPSPLSTVCSVHTIPQIPDSLWPPTPETLRPPLEQTRSVLEHLIEDFASTRVVDVVHILNLSETLDTLRSLLSSI